MLVDRFCRTFYRNKGNLFMIKPDRWNVYGQSVVCLIIFTNQSEFGDQN